MRFPPRAPLLPAALALGSGIALDHHFAIAWTTSAIVAALGLVLWCKLAQAQVWRAASLALLISIAANGALWHHAAWSLYRTDDIGCRATPHSEPCRIEAIIADIPQWQPSPPFDPLRALPASDTTRCLIWVTTYREHDAWRIATGWARLRIDGRAPGLAAGTKVRITGQLALPPAALNPGQPDPEFFARCERTRAEVFVDDAECLEILPGPKTWSLGIVLADVQLWCRGELARRLDRERFGLGRALLLGGYDDVAAPQLDAFVASGAMHVLSISGLHVGWLAGVCLWLVHAGLVPRRSGLVVIGSIVVAYALLVGGETPVVRATVLVLLCCFALGMSRRTAGLNAWSAAAIVALAIAPADLFRAGPQLSFLCVLAMTILPPLRWSAQRPEGDLAALMATPGDRSRREVVLAVGKWLADMLWLSLGVFLATAPLVAYHFHLVSPGIVLLNLLIAIPVAVALLSGLAILILAPLPPLAAVAGWFCNTGLWAMEGLAWLCQATPLSHFSVTGAGAGWLIAGYLALGVVLVFRERLSLPALCTGLTIWMALACLPAIGQRVHPPARCTFLAVGHGVSVVLELPDGHTLLYDVGQFSQPQSAGRIVTKYLWSRGITRLDAVVLSHSDVDHFNGLPELIRRVPVSAVYVAPTFLADHGAAVAYVKNALEQAAIPVRLVRSGDRFQTGPDVSLSIVQAAAFGPEASDNAESVVLLFEVQGRRILLTGDLEGPGLAELLAAAPLPCDIILAPHHGSRQSDPAAIAAWCHPQHVVISRGRRPETAWTESIYQQSGATIYATPTTGAATFTIRAGKIDVETFCTGE